MSNTLDYYVGQIVNIGYYGGFHNQKRLMAKAEITNIDKDMTGLIDIKVFLNSGGYRKMFGYASNLKELEDNYIKWMEVM